MRRRKKGAQATVHMFNSFFAGLQEFAGFIRNSEKTAAQIFSKTNNCLENLETLIDDPIFCWHRNCVSGVREGQAMADQKDKFGETMKLMERAKEDIYFAEHDRQLIEKIKAQLREVKKTSSRINCPKCPGELETYTFQGFILDRCHNCGGIWMDKGELEGVIRKVTRSPLGAWIDKLMGKEEEAGKEGAAR